MTYVRQKGWIEQTHLHGAFAVGWARAGPCHSRPSSPTHHSSRWYQSPLYRLKTSEVERSERESTAPAVRRQGAWLWTQFWTIPKFVFPPQRTTCLIPQRRHPLRHASWSAPPKTGALWCSGLGSWCVALQDVLVLSGPQDSVSASAWAEQKLRWCETSRGVKGRRP